MTSSPLILTSFESMIALPLHRRKKWLLKLLKKLLEYYSKQYYCVILLPSYTSTLWCIDVLVILIWLLGVLTYIGLFIYLMYCGEYIHILCYLLWRCTPSAITRFKSWYKLAKQILTPRIQFCLHPNKMNGNESVSSWFNSRQINS